MQSLGKTRKEATETKVKGTDLTTNLYLVAGVVLILVLVDEPNPGTVVSVALCRHKDEDAIRI